MSSQYNMYGPHWHVQAQDVHHMIKINQEIHISPKTLNIIWGNDSRYCQWTPLQKIFLLVCLLLLLLSFPDGAELLQVNCIEFTWKLDFSHLRPNEKYEIVYVSKFKVDACEWHSCPIKFKTTTTDGQATEISVILESSRKVIETWHEVSGGEFKVNSTTREGAVHFGMYEIGSDSWKGSMILQEVKISDDGPVELLQVSWLEETGSLDLKKLEAKDYKLSFTISMRPDAFGWKGSPVYFMATVGEGKIIWKRADLSELPVNTDRKIPAELKFTVTTKASTLVSMKYGGKDRREA